MLQTKISLKVSKLGAEIPTVNLPPYRTCRPDAPCKSVCYAAHGRFNYSNVKKAHLHNLACYIENPENYFNGIVNFLTSKLISYKYFRFHSSGDIIDSNYLQLMCKTAKKCKSVKFLCFTKKFELVNDYLKSNTIPSNLKIVFSAWDKSFKIDNPYNLPVAYVNFKHNELNPDIPELSIPCSGKCYECLSCWTLKPGQSVVFNQHK